MIQKLSHMFLQVLQFLAMVLPPFQVISVTTQTKIKNAEKLKIFFLHFSCATLHISSYKISIITDVQTVTSFSVPERIRTAGLPLR
ncbi:MAG: hypothetical protein IJZ34_11130, partial [Lachnospiraceae bacterium]|nr:hypothetical protein [Lachnospiraceae bacterium]